MLEHITSIWADKLALVSPEERRKLCALGLAHLCGSGWSPVMKVWPSAITAIVEVVYDVTMEDSNQDKLVRLNACTLFCIALKQYVDLSQAFRVHFFSSVVGVNFSPV